MGTGDTMAINAVLAVIPVAEIEDACAWYTSFFGRPPDQRPMDSLAEWHLADGGVVQIFQDPAKSGRTTVNFSINDLDDRVTALTAHGITTTDPVIVSSGRQRLITCPDPDGNQLGLLEPAT
ncbi:VOC family protein [Kribbella sp. NPDC050820]|uniref:VOC family protein n=1 Tax=unclassified Kribbella TaxID=2644121 RepID=UPI0033C5D799